MSILTFWADQFAVKCVIGWDGTKHVSRQNKIIPTSTENCLTASALAKTATFTCISLSFRHNNDVIFGTRLMPVNGTCRWCRKDMPEEATICTECNRHDSRLFEHGKAFLTVASIAGALFSAAIFAADPASRIFSALFYPPNVEILSFRTERSSLIRNDAGRYIFVTRYAVSVPLDEIENDARIPKRQIARTFDLIEKEIPPGRTIQIDTLSLSGKRAVHLDGNGAIEPVINIPASEFPYVIQFRDDNLKNEGRILYYADNDPELISRIDDSGKLQSLTKANCVLFYTAEFSRDELSKTFPCRAVAGFVGDFVTAVGGYQQWKAQRNTIKIE